jgi:hypothetical protein
VIGAVSMTTRPNQPDDLPRTKVGGGLRSGASWPEPRRTPGPFGRKRPPSAPRPCQGLANSGRRRRRSAAARPVMWPGWAFSAAQRRQPTPSGLAAAPTSRSDGMVDRLHGGPRRPELAQMSAPAERSRRSLASESRETKVQAPGPARGPSTPSTVPRAPPCQTRARAPPAAWGLPQAGELGR